MFKKIYLNSNRRNTNFFGGSKPASPQGASKNCQFDQEFVSGEKPIQIEKPEIMK